MLRKAAMLLSGNALAALMSLARNLLIARLVSVEDYGIAATFAIAMAAIEMASYIGLQQMIVQDKGGDDPKLQAGLQGFQALRGLLGAVLLLLIAGPLAAFLGIPEVAWAYQLLALVPLANGFVHFDVWRLNRQLNYRPLILTEALPPALSLAAVWPLVAWTGDWRAMLYALLIQWGLRLVFSHLTAERRYRLSLDLSVITRSVDFGWPLLVNGALMFAVFHGDKLIVGRLLGLEALAILAMGVTLTLTPTTVAGKSLQAFFLPQLSRIEGRPEAAARFESLGLAALQASVMVALGLVLGVVLVGGPFVALVLGPAYAALAPLLVWCAIQQGLRVFKSGAATVALARGQTGNALAANLMRVATLPVAWVVAERTGDLTAVIWVAIAGEALGYGVALALVGRRARIPLAPLYPVLAAAALGFLAAAATLYAPAPLGIAGVLVATALALAASGALRGALRDWARAPKAAMPGTPPAPAPAPAPEDPIP